MKKVSNSLFFEGDQDVFEDILDVKLPEKVGKAFYEARYGNAYTGEWTTDKNFPKYKHLLKSNQGYHYWDSSAVKEAKDANLQILQEDEVRNVNGVFQGLHNPYTNTSIVLATRSNYDDFAKALGKDGAAYWNKTNSSKAVGDYPIITTSSEEVEKGYLFMLGLPCGHTGAAKEYYVGWRKSYDEQKKGEFVITLNGLITSNVFGGVTPPDNWAEEIWHYATTGQSPKGKNDEDLIPVEGQAWIDKHLCPWPLWGSASRKASGKFCKYTCTEESIELIAAALYDKYTVSGDTETPAGSGMSLDFHVLLIDCLYSALSNRMAYEGIVLNTKHGTSSSIRGKFPDDNYALTNEPTSFVTIDYHDGEGGPTTGSLKILTLADKFSTDRADIYIFADRKAKVPVNTLRSVYWTINQTNTKEFPVIWKLALHRLVCKNHASNPFTDGRKIWSGESPESRIVVRFAREFYDNLRTAMPAMLAYRYQNQVFSEFTNSLGKSLVDYEDQENTIVAKAIPIMEVEHLKDVFYQAFNGGNFEAGKQFSYSHCIVDLDPTLSDYNPDPEARSEFKVKNGQFPMTFASGVNVNVDEYKTKKLVLQRIEKISGERFDTFTMGSHASDYDLVTDPKKRKYKDDESILDAAVEDFAQVTLGNGGSYQKNHPARDLNNKDREQVQNDIYEADLTTDNPRRVPRRHPETGVLIPDKYEAKYFKNKHFFMDPFELTIAQWCYIHLNSETTKSATPARARELLGYNAAHPEQSTSEFMDIQRSFWRYVCVWGEKGEWQGWKDRIANLRGIDVDEDDIVEVMPDDGVTDSSEVLSTRSDISAPTGTPPSDDDETVINKLCSTDWYNPLEDTRPYYYATYDDVRGTGQVYVDRETSTTYVIDPNKKDEFQMNTRTGGTSFMDILNTKVVFQTQKRIYRNCDYDSANTTPADRATSDHPQGIGLVSYYQTRLDGGTSLDDIPGAQYDSLGESPLARFLMIARDNKLGISPSDRMNWWCSGKEGGINFDLPTEAQWEYCCRDGSTFAVPPQSDLGEKFEENYEPLDLIAWYKFKVIGSLPEPERFCAWRVSKMLFGIGKDKEQINNVYEKEEEQATR